MFRLEVYVEKKHIGDVFERLTGIADIRTCALVPNGKMKPNGKIYATAADTVELLTKEIHKQKLTEIRGPEFKTLLTKVGLNPSSYSHFIGGLIQAGVLKKGKRTGNSMQYIVTGE